MEDTATLAQTRNTADTLITLPPINAKPERLERITVCTRPFRASGPRLEAERLGGKTLIHNYGHGGSGWSLSWGCAERVLQLLRNSIPPESLRDIAVIGCGAMGLTTAVTLQRAGLRVRIYARDLPPAVRSSRATGLWSPDSRFALAKAVGEQVATQWEATARQSWSIYLGLAAQSASPVTFHDRYLLSELPPAEAIAQRQSQDPIGFVHLEHRLADLCHSDDFGPGEHPFATAWARRLHTLRFDISAFTEKLLTDFREAGGHLVEQEFHSPGELCTLPESAIVHCTGYSARALFGDESLTPIRGQIGWLPAQPKLGYSLQWNRLSVVPRADGIAVQVGASSDDTGWNDAGEQPDRSEAEDAVNALARLQAGLPVA